MSLVIIDLDGFKAVNDWRGHAAGDQLLVDLAGMWTARLRRCDVIGRHGGDEFVLLLPATNHEQATVAVSRLKDDSPIAWSAGVAEWGPAESFEAWLARADSNLYLAKPDRTLPVQRATDPGVRPVDGGPSPQRPVERVTGIEPAWPAWKAGALPLSYTRVQPAGEW